MTILAKATLSRTKAATARAVTASKTKEATARAVTASRIKEDTDREDMAATRRFQQRHATWNIKMASIALRRTIGDFARVVYAHMPSASRREACELVAELVAVIEAEDVVEELAVEDVADVLLLATAFPCSSTLEKRYSAAHA